MRRLLLVLPLATLVLAGWPAKAIAGGEDLKSRGTIVSMATDSITVKVGQTDMKFAVDDKTQVMAPGGSTKTRAAEAAGKSGPKLAELLKVGDNVEVSYTDAGGRHASSIRKVSSPGSAGVPAKNAAGKVTAVSASSLSIEGSGGGGAKFTQTFVLDDKTHVVVRGATAATKGTGRATADTMIHNGDDVSVSFTDAGGSLHASEVTVMRKASPK